MTMALALSYRNLNNNQIKYEFSNMKMTKDKKEKKGRFYLKLINKFYSLKK